MTSAAPTTAGTPAAAAPPPSVWWGVAGVSLLALLVVGQIVAVVLFVEHERTHDRTARRTATAITPSMRALELENRELRAEVAQLKAEMEKQLYAAARAAAAQPPASHVPAAAETAARPAGPAATPPTSSVQSAFAVAAAQLGAVPPPARTRSAMLRKSVIIRAGM